MECASEANGQVNEQRYGKGKWATPEQCQERVSTPSGQQETRAEEMGRVKHAVALECARQKLEEAFPGN